MDPRLLNYYNKELVYMREKAAIFAEQHPKIAKRLGMQGMDVADPYVERLIEAFCFMSARTQIKLDAGFPQFTQHLLEVIAPHYLSPMPAISVAQFHPAAQQGDLLHGIQVPKHTRLRSRIAHGEQVACEFRTGQAMTLWPISIEQVSVIDPAHLDYPADPERPVQQAIKICLKTLNQYAFSDLKGCSSLPVYLSGEEHIASQLFEYLHTATVATVISGTGTAQHVRDCITHQPVMHEGLAPEHSLLPNQSQTNHGNHLLQEYFACPSRFLFFTLTQLAPALSRINSQEADIILLCDKPLNDLLPHIDQSQFALHCTPVVNLFPGRIDHIEMDKKHHEFHVTPDRTHPVDYEIFSVENVRAQRPESTETLDFRPLFHTLHQDKGNYGTYFSVRREQRQLSEQVKKYGARTHYTGSEVFLSLVDQHEAPYPEHIRYLSVEALLTNRDLPAFIPRNGQDDLFASDTFPVSAIGLIRPPSSPKSPLADQAVAWKLIQQLSFHYQSLMNQDPQQRAQSLQQLLRLYVSADQQAAIKQTQSIHRIDMQSVTRRLPHRGPPLFGRGIHYDIHVDENHFSGSSPYLLVLLIAQWLNHHSAINTFSEIACHSIQRGLIHQWPMSVLSGKAI